MGALKHSPGCRCCPACERDVQFTLRNCFGPDGFSSEVQALELTGAPDGGTFTLSYPGIPGLGPPYNQPGTTQPIAWNAAAAGVQAALEALPAIGTGNVTVTGSALPDGPLSIDFGTGVLAGKAIGLIVGHPANLKPGDDHQTPGVSVTETTLGGQAMGNVPPSATVTLTSDEYQQLSIAGKPTGGTFTLTFQGATTVPIAWNAPPATVQGALEALPGIGAGNVAVAAGQFGQTLPGFPYFVTFQGALKAQALPLLTGDASNLTPNDKGQTYAVAVNELLAGGTVLGPLDVDNTYGTVTFKQVAAGPWEYRASAASYNDSTGRVVVLCPPKTPAMQVGVALVVADGFIIADGTPAPFKPPGAITVNMGNDVNGAALGTSSLALGACVQGTAHYKGTLHSPNATFAGASADFTYFLKIGCSAGLCVVWVLNIPGQPGVGNRDFPVANCNDCGEPSPLGLDLSGFPYGGVCAYCTGYTDFNSGFGTGETFVFRMSCGEPVTFTDQGFIGVVVWGGGCYGAPAKVTLGNGVSFGGGQNADVLIGSAINDQMYVIYGGKGATAACPACSAS